MKVIAEKNMREIATIILAHVLWIIPVATGIYFELKWPENGEVNSLFFVIGAVFVLFSVPYTIYFCNMPKVILSITSNYELILPHNKVIPLSHVEKMQVKVYGRQMIELYTPSGMLIIKTASKTYHYYFIKDPDDVQEQITLLLHEFRERNQQFDNCEPIV